LGGIPHGWNFPGRHLLQVLLRLIQPYTRVRIPFISSKLNIPEQDVEGLLVPLILDGRLKGHIDQVRTVPAWLWCH
jgi:hypothetical protein